MAADQTPPDGAPTSHRPLPAVGMALLRDDVQADRRRKAIAVALLAGVAIVAAAIVALLPASEGGTDELAAAGPAVPVDVGLTPDGGPAPPDAGPPPPPPEPLAVEETASGTTRTTHAFGRSPGFRPALTSAGLSGEEADAVTTALTGLLDFRRCRPDHELVIERGAAGLLSRFEYRASIVQIYEVTRTETGALSGREVEVPVQRTLIARGGVVTSSLGSALDAASLGRTMVGTFVETFDGRIDFNTETREGDAFRVLVDEERVAGEFLRWGDVHAIEYRSRRQGTLRGYYFEAREGEGDYYDETGRAFHGGWLRTPLRYDHISSPFDPRRMHPVLRRIMPHNGVDFAAGTGTPVWAAADGEITFIGPRGANGNLVSIRHESGYESHYAHLSRFASGLSRGDTVRQRQIIGYVGSTGRSTGPHLHFGLKRHGRFVDPQAELNGPGRQLPGAQMTRFRARLAELRRLLDAIPIPEVAVDSAAAPVRPRATTDATD